jgi:hypothetical protein
MDAYPSYYIAHNVPLIVLSGLGPEHPEEAKKDGSQFPAFEGNGIRVSSTAPTIETTDATQLLKHFLAADVTRIDQSSRKADRKASDPVFRIKAMGRVGLSISHISSCPERLSTYDMLFYTFHVTIEIVATDTASKVASSSTNNGV